LILTESADYRHTLCMAAPASTSCDQAAYLDVDVSTISVVYPFAEPCFAAQPRPRNETGRIRVLFAGRLSPEKGI
jgi:hypothetical protein